MEHTQDRQVVCPACGGSYDREYGVCPQCGAVCPPPPPAPEEETGGLFPPFVPRWRKGLVFLAAVAALVSGWLLWQGPDTRPPAETAPAAVTGTPVPAQTSAPPADTVSSDAPA